MFKYIKSPNHIEGNQNEFNKVMDHSIFLAGTITGAEDWQAIAAQKLLPHINVINPRRDNYPSFDEKVERKQITWEHYYLTRVNYVLFYFSWETLAPITLLEYGTFLERIRYNYDYEMFVAVHPEYKRKRDVYIQTDLYLGYSKNHHMYSSLDEAIQGVVTILG